jgi:hypothetical protein
VGNPIDCIHTKDIPEDVLNTFCWIHSTYTIPSAFLKIVGEEVPYPGVDNSRTTSPSDRKYTKYYQWVCFCLFFQVNIIINQLLFQDHLPLGTCVDLFHRGRGSAFAFVNGGGREGRGAAALLDNRSARADRMGFARTADIHKAASHFPGRLIW